MKDGKPFGLPVWDEIEARLSMTQPHPIKVSASPHVLYLVEPAPKAVALICVDPSGEITQPVRPARGIRVQPHGTSGEVAVWIDEEAVLELGWAFLSALGERVLQGESFKPALASELERWLDLVAPLPETTHAAALGVLGELAVLRALMTLGHDVTCWAGMAGGSHDFRFADTDLEVKATTGGKHRHMINGASQLVPAPDHQLFLLSIVAGETETGSGSSVTSLVADLSGLGVDRSWLEGELRKRRSVRLGDKACRASYVLMQPVLAVSIGPGFPAITPNLLSAALGENSSRLADVTYRLDLDGMQPASDPPITSMTGIVKL